ncbi:Mu transposase domain-containing protein, partial [Deferribacter abyssi]|uniref:Mu transposase domain-containing protein n=1 Tax=Deferribacter abyssi TaxID=213806 RepID=UPI003C2387B9
ELSPLPSDEIIDFYLNYKRAVKVHKDSLIYYGGKRYSVPPEFIGKTLKIREEDGYLYIYKDNEIIRIYKLSDSFINYSESDYKSLMLKKLKGKTIEEIEELSLKNLELLSGLKGANNE